MSEQSTQGTPRQGVKPSGAAGERRFYALHLIGEPQPYAVAARTGNGVPERYVPGQGWVDMPVLSDYFTGEDPGAKEITAEEAHTYIEGGLGQLGEGAVEKLRGAE